MSDLKKFGVIVESDDLRNPDGRASSNFAAAYKRRTQTVATQIRKSFAKTVMPSKKLPAAKVDASLASNGIIMVECTEKQSSEIWKVKHVKQVYIPAELRPLR